MCSPTLTDSKYRSLVCASVKQIKVEMTANVKLTPEAMEREIASLRRELGHLRTNQGRAVPSDVPTPTGGGGDSYEMERAEVLKLQRQVSGAHQELNSARVRCKQLEAQLEEEKLEALQRAIAREQDLQSLQKKLRVEVENTELLRLRMDLAGAEQRKAAVRRGGFEPTRRKPHRVASTRPNPPDSSSCWLNSSSARL